MSETTARSIRSVGEGLEEAGIEAVWAQWSALGAGTLQSGGPTSAIIDPEALLLLSLYLIPKEKRLRDLTRWWAEAGSELLSLQRTKTLAEDFPIAVEDRLRTYSYWAVEAGDRRWKKYAEKPEDTSGRERKGPEEPKLRSSTSLLLRLRAGFGVSAKADVLAFLLGTGEQAATVKKAVQATGYSRATISGALEDLSRAGFIRKSDGRPAEYRAPAELWKALLFESEPERTQEDADVPKSKGPAWRYWRQLFPFLARAREWAREAESLSEYMASTRARDLFEEFRWALEANRIRVPLPTRYQGGMYLDGFLDGLKQTTRWIPEHL